MVHVIGSEQSRQPGAATPRMTSNENDTPQPKGSAVGRLWPVAALLAAIAALFLFGPDNQTVFEALREHRQTMLGFVADNAVVAGATFFVIYVIAIAFSVPGGAMMTIVGGFLFGPVVAASYVVFAATLGATILFIVARGTIGNRLRERAGPWLAKMEAGFQDNALNYLLVLRLVPLFPFFIVNLVPAFLGVSMRTYVVGTFLGIIPGTFVFALAGGGVGSVLDQGGDFDLSNVLTSQLIAALIGLGLLALTPVVYKWMRARKQAAGASGGS